MKLALEELTKHLVLASVACSTLTTAGCGATPSTPSNSAIVAIVDGVRVVENVDPVWPETERWKISSEPVVTLGVDIGAPEQMFSSYVSPPFALSDDRIVVPDSSNEVRFFDATGSYAGSVGRQGAGPCEFGRIGRAYPARDDSIVVEDTRLRRFVIYDGSGECVDTRSLDAHGESYGMARIVGRFADGSLFARAYDAFPQGVRGTTVWRNAAFLRYQQDGSAPHLLVELPILEMIVGSELSVVFGAVPIVVAHGDRVFYAPGDTTEVLAYDTNGNLVQRFSRRFESQPVTQADRDAWMEMSRRNVDAVSEGSREFAQRTLSLVAFDDVMPAVRGLVVDELGNIWVERHVGLFHTRAMMLGAGIENFVADTSTWDVFTPDGIWLGPVALVPDREPTFIGEDYVLMRGADAAGVAHVWKYALIKPR